jgi:hypothetical protein
MGLGKLFRRRKARQKKAAQELARKAARSSNAASSTPHTIDTVEIISIEGPSMTCLEAIATNLTPRFDEQQHYNNTSSRHAETLLANKRTPSRVSQNSNDDSSDSSEDEHSESSSSSSSQSHSSQSHSDESDETSKVYIDPNEEQEEDEDHDDSSCSSNSSQFTQDTFSIIHRNVIVASDDLEQVFSALQSIEDIEELDESSLGDEGDIDLNPIENGSRTTASTNSKSLCKSVLSRSYKSLDDTVSKSSTTHDTGSVYTNRPAVQCYPNDNSLGYLFDFVTCTKTDRRGCIAGVIDDDNFTIATHSDNESMLTGRLGVQQKISMFGRSESPSLAGVLGPNENVGSAMKLVSVTTEKTVHTTNCTSESLSKVEEEGDNGDWNESDEDSFVFFDKVCAPSKCQGLGGDSDSVDEDDRISPSTSVIS